MHHHHPPLPITTTAVAAAATSSNAVVQSLAQQQLAPPAQQQRRRKKRPNYGTRVVEVRRGYNGFGFTISGQQPCRLSCIITDSPADQAGLRSGDFLISVNGLNVSKLPHETVVQLIGNSFGSIRMQIAENYYSDSSDEENANSTLLQQQSARGLLASVSNGLRAKPRFIHHKTKMHRFRSSPQKKRSETKQQPPMQLQQPLQQAQSVDRLDAQCLHPVMEDLPMPPVVKAVSHVMPATNGSADVANVSAMVRVVSSVSLEYRAIVGYLGTIEMPKQISHSSKLQTVRSCIRKLRQEKRQPTVVLMSILPDCLRLQNASGNLLATYASSRLNYVSSSSESENRFFGLVTSAIHNTQIEEEYELEPQDDKSTTGHISISHSCHVFVIDTKLIDHQQHLQRACEFRIQCTRDPISNLCLEFPNNSEYVVNLIRSMYTMRILPPATRNISDYDAQFGGVVKPAVQIGGAAAHSPQPSNHSEISTTTSNSDSGIGFNNDCTNISDRILVVDFAGAPAMVHAAAASGQVVPTLQHINQRHARPLGICCDAMSTSDKRLTVRAMPDPKSPPALRRPNLLDNFNLIKSPANSLTATRSCDDVLNLVDDKETQLMPPHASMDDISLHANTNLTALNDAESYTFLHPATVLLTENKRRTRQSLQPTTTTTKAPDKLSPQVFIGNKSNENRSLLPKSRHSLGFQAIDAMHKSSIMKDQSMNSDIIDTWSSLQNINTASSTHTQTITNCLLEATNSEPDLGNRALPANASPFRRAWGQSSFRTPRTDKLTKQQQLLLQQQQQRNGSGGSPLVKRSASMTASDNDVYIKTSMDNGCIDEFKQTRNRRQLGMLQVPQIRTDMVASTTSGSSNAIAADAELNEGPSGVSGWGTSFERMLQDPAGMQTFAEFLKKEFSAENIYFWTACERYRLLDNEAERVALAHEIFNKHLSTSGTDPVNVDSQARNLSQEKLQNAARDIFAPAQKQIFNLMKFDSYQRFIRSDLYKSCVEAEEKHQALPYSGEDLDDLLKTNFHLLASSTKLKKSASNAEDRRRKSLLPWHRKTRSKSRDRNELLSDNLNHVNQVTTHMLMPAPTAPATHGIKLSALSSSSLKIASTQNSLSDIHSSRSSLSSFDASGGNSLSAETVCSLCRVILSDGATTIVQTRVDETVAQLVERLLEKRGLSYQYYDVVFNGCNKSIDMQLPSHTLAGKEVLIEQRVVFKLDLPDPKVISVKSKPKKQLHEVIRPILHKYNYSMSDVQVLLRETHEPLDLMQPVTAVEGQRLQIVLVHQQQSQQQQPQLMQDFQQSGGSNLPPKFLKTSNNSNLLPGLAKRAAAIGSLRNGTTQSGALAAVVAAPSTAAQNTLDEITNKVFNELLQGKVEAAAEKPKANDQCSLKSEDCGSENSSIFGRMRRRDSNIPGTKLPKLKKKSITSQHSEELPANVIQNAIATDPKKPIIAKLKAGVKLQVTERVAENQDELLEGLKRAQLARLEDQRGTEINFELPDFLKNKENISAAASKLRKIRASLSPINAKLTSASMPTTTTSAPNTPTIMEAPQPAPRLSITLKQNKSISPMKVDEETSDIEHNDAPESPNSANYNNLSIKGPPPLPPKPKVLPIKPSNWGATTNSNSTTKCNVPTVIHSSTVTQPTSLALPLSPSKIPIEIGRKPLLNGIEPPPARCAYLDEPSSSFV